MAARRALADAFRTADLDTPELDARVLVGYALGLDHTTLAADGSRVLDAEASDAIAALATRRLGREPVARIVGHREFWGLPLRVTPATLVPRPETETVVEAALACIDSSGGRARPLNIADLGTGTGALLLALLSELPAARGIGTDISPEALVVARDNAARLGFTARTEFVVSDFGAMLPGGYDLVVSNPPYVASRDIATLAPEAASEPRLALDGGRDGLDGYRAVAADAHRLLAPGGHLVFELGFGQQDVVTALIGVQGLETVSVRSDLSGTPRALSLRVATIAP
jgi:release factor glutamine methyltransferase